MQRGSQQHSLAVQAVHAPGQRHTCRSCPNGFSTITRSQEPSEGGMSSQYVCEQTGQERASIMKQCINTWPSSIAR